MPNQLRIGYEQLVAGIARSLAQAGVPTPNRDVEAQVMAEADLLGVPSHGVRTLPPLVRALREGRATIDPQIKIARERFAACVLDGDNGTGRYVSVQGMQQAIGRAKQYGAGVCLATRVTHWGRAHAYAYRAALAGCIGICTTNAIPNMLAWGSKQPLLGNNPLAIAVPRGSQDPIVLDMAMSQAAVGKVGTFLREGKPVPSNWGLDSNGQPTNDPAAILASHRVLPFGDHKGAGLALMLELVTGALGGGLLSQEIVKKDSTGLDPESTKLFIALDVQAFIETDRFSERVNDLLALVQEIEPSLTVTWPGERGWQTRAQYLAEGIPIHSEIVEQLQAIGVAWPA